MKAFLDIDGVLADFLGAAFKAHGREFKEEEYPAALWNCEDFLGLTTEEFWEPLGCHSFWENLSLTTDCWDIMGAAESAVGLANVCLLTSPSESFGAGSGKMAFIATHFSTYWRTGRFLIGRAKHFVAHPGAILIDDNDQNCRNFKMHGGESILVPRRWNSDHAVANRAAAIVRAKLHIALEGVPL